VAESTAADAPPVEAPPPRSAVRDYAFTLILVFIVLSATRQDLGFLLPLLSPFLLLWFMRPAWIAWRQPARRKVQAIKFASVVAAVALAAFLQGNIQRQAREHALQVVSAVAAYRAQHGSYPDDLAQAGLDENALRRWRVRYISRDNRHRVTYPAVFTVFDGYSYDFDKPGWVYSAE
jgi:hypothetical protein